MSLNPAQIELADEQKIRLAQIAEREGKSCAEVIDERLAAAPANGESVSESALAVEPPQGNERTLYDVLNERGLIGAAEGLPPDLSTNPKYMEGFGRHAHESNPD